MRIDYFITIVFVSLILGGCSPGTVNKKASEKDVNSSTIINNKKEVTLVLDFGNGDISTSSALSADTAYEALDKTAKNKNLEIKADNNYDFGILVEGIGGFFNSSSQAWMYYVNGQMPSVAADKYELEDGDLVEWKYEKPNF